ncbi:uncharacterized protein [Asterias amurensis]|uniref:uncharacterized protein isoform X2 n=1 Tax=Asterias amurensis TaxID=7602 RepID=UPI003AB791E4
MSHIQTLCVGFSMSSPLKKCLTWFVDRLIRLLQTCVIAMLFRVCVALVGIESYYNSVKSSQLTQTTENKMATDEQSPGAKTRRVLLWAPPRSLSTAFERCISALGDDVQIFHEMYTAACHIGPENQIKIPMFESVLRDPLYTYARVQKILEAPAPPKKQIFFCKELAYTVDGKFDKLPAGYRHTFLIRHPARVFISMNKMLKKYFARTFLNLQLNQVVPEGFVFKEMYRLFEHVTNDLGQEPIIIDADDLMQNPLGVLCAYCNAVDIPFSPSMDKWRPIKEEKRSWIYSTRIMIINKLIGQYERAFKTTGLEKHSERPIDLSLISPDVLEATKASIGYYEKMYALRLKPVKFSPKTTLQTHEQEQEEVSATNDTDEPIETKNEHLPIR